MENDRPVSTTPGAMVRAAREASGLSLADLAAATRIPAGQLRALEADDHDQLSGPLYVRSFLRSCAEALDLDPHDLLAAYDSRRPAEAVIPAPGPTWSQETQIRHAAGFPWRRVGLLGAVLLVVALAVLAIVRIAGGGGAPAAEADADPGRSRREALGDSLREAWSPLTNLAAADSLALAAADSALADSFATGFAGGDSAAAALPDSAAADSLGAPPVAAQARAVTPSAGSPEGRASQTTFGALRWPSAPTA